jgi:hypothetical protein
MLFFMQANPRVHCDEHSRRVHPHDLKWSSCHCVSRAPSLSPCCTKRSPLYPLKGPSTISLGAASSAAAAGMVGEPNNTADAMTAADRRATAVAGALLLDSADMACTVTLRDLLQLRAAMLLLCMLECSCMIVPATAADDLVCGYASGALVSQRDQHTTQDTAP